MIQQQLSESIDLAENEDLAGTTLTIASSEVHGARSNRAVPEFNVPTLRVVAGPDMLRFASIYPGQEVKIGRDESCQLVLSHGSVSRYHCMVRSNENGQLTVEDLGSTNGTKYNGERVTSPVPVRVGDEVQVGRVTLKIESLGLNELSHLSKVVERLTLASKDALTGLVTRHFLKEELPNLVIRHKLAGVPLAICFIDLDHFGQINKKHLHETGDDVLRTVARLMVMHLRDSDICVRYGGEEFLAILPNCEEGGAFRSAERLRIAVQDHDWSVYAEDLIVTASIGVAIFRPAEETKEWIRRANEAMTYAKENGRNQTIRASLFTPEVPTSPNDGDDDGDDEFSFP